MGYINSISALAILASALGCLAPSPANGTEIEGYLSSFSVAQGTAIDLYVSTDSPTYQVKLFRIGESQKIQLAVYEDVPGITQISPNDAWQTGAQWINPFTLQTSSTWESGLYELVLKIIDSATGNSIREYLNFVIRENNPGSTSDILIVDSAPTSVAYNNWGGKSLYDFNSTDGQAVSVSLLRPGQHRSQEEAYALTHWLNELGLVVEYASMLDVQNDPTLFSYYQTIVFYGHNEYWSKPMRLALDEHVEAGGNAMILSGNTMWWQIRIEGDQMICYRDKSADDPMRGVDDSLVTTHFWEDPVNDPENRSIGVSWRNGGYVNSQGFYPASEGWGGYIVTNESHEVFAYTGLANGEMFGQFNTIVGYEADGALFEWVDGMPSVTGDDGTPLNFEILAYSPAETPRWAGNATMGIFEVGMNGGKVFNAATVDWADGLFEDGRWRKNDSGIADQQVSQITWNVLKLMGHTPPDADFDGIPDGIDNCPTVANGPLIPDQEGGGSQQDDDGDGIGNACDLRVTTTSLRSARAGKIYSQQLEAIRGLQPYTWTLIQGTLPTGLSLTSSGLLTGEVQSSFLTFFTVQVMDATSDTATQELSIAITLPNCTNCHSMLQ